MERLRKLIMTPLQDCSQCAELQPMTTTPIVLINIYYSESGYGERLHYPPLGISYLSEYLEQHGVEHAVLDMGLGYSGAQILTKINELQPQWAAFSLNSLQLNLSQKLIQELRAQHPQAKIVVGGPHVTTQKEKIFQDLPEIDYAIIGEGEQSFYELISNQIPSEIPGLVYKDSQGQIKVQEKRITLNLDLLPFPRFKKFALQDYVKKTIPLISSRGCPFQCIFCQQSSLLSKNWRGVSAEQFIATIKYWLTQGYQEFQILDDNFVFDSQRLKKIVELYEKEQLPPIKLILVGGMRVTSATSENLQLLKRLGVDFISLGIESYSDKVLSFIRKGITEKQIEEAIKNTTTLGFKVRLFFIIGFPYQTVESLQRTYRLVLQYPIYQVRFFNLIPYENTYLMEWLREHGELICPSQIYMNDFKRYQDIPIFKAADTMSPEERTQELQKARQVEKLVEERARYLFGEI